MKSKKISINNIDAFVFDFDGVLTDNSVIISENGSESVVCSRADGLAFNALKKMRKPAFIISSEKNKVVKIRANKIGATAFYGVSDKVKALKKIIKNNHFKLDKIFYVGNDINDYEIMKICELTACPADSSDHIKRISKFICKKKGGQGVVREILEDILKINLLNKFEKI